MSERVLDKATQEARKIIARDFVAFDAAYHDLVAMLRVLNVGAAALRVGDEIPPFALPNTEGRFLSSDALLAAGPLVLSFYRGEWCRFCRCELDAFAGSAPAIADAGGRIVFVTGETGGRALQSQRQRNASFEILCDADLGVAMRFGLVFSLPGPIRTLYDSRDIVFREIYGNESGFLPIPATYVVAPDGRIIAAHVDPDFGNRMDPADVIAALKRLQK